MKTRLCFQFIKTLMWIITICCITLTFLPEQKRNQNSSSLAVNSLLLATFRDIWAVSISWIILTTHSHSWQWITNALSHKNLISFGKLGLCFYLVHPMILALVTTNRKQPILFDQSGMVTINLNDKNYAWLIFSLQLINVFGDFLLTFVFSILVHLFVEAPFTQFARVLSRCCNSNKIKWFLELVHIPTEKMMHVKTCWRLAVEKIVQFVDFQKNVNS